MGQVSEYHKKRFSELANYRADLEPIWKKISELIGGRFVDVVTPDTKSLSNNRLLDAHGKHAAARLAAQLHGQMINPGAPWVVPHIEMDEMPDEVTKWLSKVQRIMHKALVSSQSKFRLAYAEFCNELVNFGNSFVWLGENRFGPTFRAVSCRNILIDVDEDGVVDTVYRQFKMKAWRLLNKYPDEPKVIDLAKKSPDSDIDLVHIVERRTNFDKRFKKDAPRNRDWTDFVMMSNCGTILGKESGHDYLPWAIGRFYKRPDEIYGYGPGEDALPSVKLANAITETILRSAENAALPPVIIPRGVIHNALDRRPGAKNEYDPQKALLVKGSISSELFPTGNAQMGVNILQLVHDQIDRAMFVDWMSLPDNIAETATAVNDRKSLRLAGLSHMVSRQETEALDPIAEHTFRVLAKKEKLPPPPQELLDWQIKNKKEAEIMFGYRTPLHLVLQRYEIDAINLTTNYFLQLEGVKEGSIDMLRLDKIGRHATQLFGLPQEFVASEAEIKTAQDEKQGAQEDANAMNNLAIGAAAAKDGATAIDKLGITPQDALGIM